MKQQILTELYQSKELADLLKKMRPANLIEDLRQELFLILCEMPDEEIVRLHTEKRLKFFTIRLLLNMVKSNTSRFYYKFRKTATVDLPVNYHVPAEDDMAIQEFEREYARKLEATKKAIDELNWYHREILLQYIEYGSAKKMVDDQKKRLNGKCIPKRSILQTVKEAKNEIRKKVTA